MLTWARRTAFGKRAPVFIALFGALLGWNAASLAQSDLPQGGSASSDLWQVPGGSGVWLSPAPALSGDGPLKLADPTTTAVLIYNHGSRSESQTDLCNPLAEDGNTTPSIVRALAGDTLAGRQLAVFVFCTGTKIGSFRSNGGGGTPKLAGRREDIAQLVDAFRDAGQPPELLFLMGHSAGGFASLLVESASPEAQNAVIAFAPAFAGRRSDRSPAWQELRQTYVRELKRGGPADALVYAFQGDPYNRPEDLAFLAGIPGVTLIQHFNLGRGDGVGCGFADPHRTVFLDCFVRAQEETLRRYLAGRLRAKPPATSE